VSAENRTGDKRDIRNETIPDQAFRIDSRSAASPSGLLQQRNILALDKKLIETYFVS